MAKWLDFRAARSSNTYTSKQFKALFFLTLPAILGFSSSSVFLLSHLAPGAMTDSVMHQWCCSLPVCMLAWPCQHWALLKCLCWSLFKTASYREVKYQHFVSVPLLSFHSGWMVYGEWHTYLLQGCTQTGHENLQNLPCAAGTITGFQPIAPHFRSISAKWPLSFP